MSANQSSTTSPSSVNREEHLQEDESATNNEDIARLQEARALFRQSSSSLNTGTPTRTLRLTAHEQQQRLQFSSTRTTSSSCSYTRDELARRPRSNPRSRTPMRYESPLEHDAFTRSREHGPSTHQESESTATEAAQNRRITIRPLAGLAVGTAVPRIHEQPQRPSTPKSSKQGQPSHRKMRRWNNDKFTGLAAEIASSNGRAADALLKGQSEAHLYRAIYDPNDHQPSKDMKEFMSGDAFREARENFFEGAGPRPSCSLLNQPRRQSSRTKQLQCMTAAERMNRIDPRLQSVVVRACRNSYAAAKVVELLEDYVVSTFHGEHSDWILIPTPPASSNRSNEVEQSLWWKGLLLQSPTVSKNKNIHSNTIDDDSCEDGGTVHVKGNYTVRFLFDADSPTGGFHRLLLQAICQFHGLNTVSRNLHDAPLSDGTICSQARVLMATGRVKEEGVQQMRLLQHLNEQQQSQQ